MVTRQTGAGDVTALAACLYTLARERHLTDGDWQVRTVQGVTTVVVRLLPLP
ncbi:hypothetical protein [Micromonospora sp. WMMD710]|uniref:hypothetical protein n=1 Tax=Micromonospora sp. WMMD710 TaxID=3016085 RepID=UPI0024180EC3|nr:hypothetical protein [Micromonospora sp. WMMD710]MDG4759265.1 hypothetical protein [Micromonospora sp. WMMD710]